MAGAKLPHLACIQWQQRNTCVFALSALHLILHDTVMMQSTILDMPRSFVHVKSLAQHLFDFEFKTPTVSSWLACQMIFKWSAGQAGMRLGSGKL